MRVPFVKESALEGSDYQRTFNVRNYNNKIYFFWERKKGSVTSMKYTYQCKDCEISIKILNLNKITIKWLLEQEKI